MTRHWCRCDYAEYPPENLLVWTTDYHTVRKGSWRLSDPRIPLEEGSWKDEAGQPIAVTEWLPVDESPDSPPQPPPSRKSCTGGIVGFRFEDDV